VHGPIVEESLVDFYDGEDSDFDRDSLQKVMSALLERLDTLSHAMRGAELALSAELSEDADYRSKRDELTETLRDKLVGAKSRLDRTYEDETTRSYGLGEMPPFQPDDLVAYAENVVNLLRQTPRTDTDLLGIELDTGRIADSIEQSGTELERALADVDAEVREAHTLRAERDKVVEEWENAYRGTATLLSGLYLLANREDLAERVRPTVRQSTGRDEPPEDVDGDLTDPLADEDESDEPEVEEPVVR
jgi:hypothetical protein